MQTMGYVIRPSPRPAHLDQLQVYGLQDGRLFGSGGGHNPEILNCSSHYELLRARNHHGNFKDVKSGMSRETASSQTLHFFAMQYMRLDLF